MLVCGRVKVDALVGVLLGAQFVVQDLAEPHSVRGGCVWGVHGTGGNKSPQRQRTQARTKECVCACGLGLSFLDSVCVFAYVCPRLRGPKSRKKFQYTSLSSIVKK